MEGEFYFMGLGALGVSLAGFAGLISALDRRPVAHSGVAAWRLRNIVRSGFMLTFVGFGTVATYTATGHDLALTVRIVTAAIAGLLLSATFGPDYRPGPAWPNERYRRVTLVTNVAMAVLIASNVWFARLGLLQLAFLYLLVGPTSIFIRTVLDVTAAPSEGDASDG